MSAQRRCGLPVGRTLRIPVDGHGSGIEDPHERAGRATQFAQEAL